MAQARADITVRTPTDLSELSDAREIFDTVWLSAVAAVGSRWVSLRLAATTIINIKPDRFGGHLTARKVHDPCLDRGVPVWCVGMLETGVDPLPNVLADLTVGSSEIRLEQG